MLRSSSQEAVSPTIAAVATVPTVASERLTPGLGGSRPTRPPSPLEQDQRQGDHADAARQLHVLDVAAEVDQPEHIQADHHPDREHEHEAGHAARPATSDAAIPSASSAPATRMRLPSSTRRVYGRV